jgi:hypothetical protein
MAKYIIYQWRLLMLATVVLLMVAMVAFSGVAFGAADERADCVGVQRSNAEKGDVGRFSRETGGQEILGHKGQKEFATQGEQPERTILEGNLETEGSGPPGPPSESVGFSVSCATISG